MASLRSFCSSPALWDLKQGLAVGDPGDRKYDCQVDQRVKCFRVCQGVPVLTKFPRGQMSHL